MTTLTPQPWLLSHIDQQLADKALNDCVEAQSQIGQIYLKQALECGSRVKEKQSAYYWLKVAGQKGCANAQYSLGYLFQHLYQNPKTAFRWFERAARQNHPCAQVALGKSYLEKAKDQLAFEYFEMAAKKNYSPGLYYLGMCYIQGQGIEQNYPQGLQYLIDSIQRKNIIRFKIRTPELMQLAQYQIGMCYYHGLGTNVQVDKALNYWLNASNNGHVESMFELGQHLFQNSTGYDAKERGADWIYEAAKKGLAPAQYTLGQMLWSGSEIYKQDIVAARYWIEKAARQDHLPALSALCDLLAKGYGKIPSNTVQAYEWAKQAIKIARRKHPLPSINPHAKSWYKSCAQKGSAKALYQVGVCYYFGYDGLRCPQKAFDSFKQAAKKEYAPALYYVGLCYAEGLGVEQNFNQALKYYQKYLHQIDV